MNLTVAKQMCFDYFARLQSKDLIVHPGLKALKTFKDNPPKVVSVVDLSLQCPSSGIAFGRFVNDLLQYSEHMIILGDPNSCPLYRAFILSCGSFATVLSTSDSGMETLADEVMKANATHVISVAPGEFLSKDFTNSSLLRQLVLSLEPGEALDVFSLDRKSYVPVAFALSNREQMIEPADRNVLTETGAKHYRMLTGTNLPGYPSYFVYKTKDF